jgi:hypothetical protein
LFDGFSFDGFPPFEYGRCSTEVDVSGRQVVQTLVVAAVVVVLDVPRLHVRLVAVALGQLAVVLLRLHLRR